MENMNGHDRRHAIIDLINDLEEVSIDYLSSKLGVSTSTIYRDMLLLESEGEIKKTTSGAIKINEFLIEKDSYFANGLKIMYSEKRDIARKAIEYINDSSSILLDAGTANFLLAKEISRSNLKDLTILTNNIITQLLLVKNSNLRVVAAGGLIKDGCASVLGDFTASMLNNILADIAFITTKGIASDGSMFEYEYGESSIKKFFIQKAKKKILLIESHKFGRMGIYNVSNIADFDMLITDSGINKEYLEMLKKLKINFQIVNV